MESFGEVLKEWRCVRRLSQLELGLAANVSARHISFLETGRAAPSRAMVLQLAETLEAPRAARNRLLLAAGFAAAYRARALEDAEMAPARQAIDWMLSRHDPYPGFGLDRHWRLVAMNAAATRLFAGLGLTTGASLIETFLSSEAIRATVENWPVIAAHFVTRLRAESAHAGGDPTLDEAARRVAETIPDPAPKLEPGPVVASRFTFGATRLSLFSTIAQFGSAEDIALADLKIELLFPADEETAAFLRALATA